MHVQFTDETQVRIDTVFAGPQDPAYYPNQGEIEDVDPRYLAFMHPELQPEAILKARQYQKDALLAAASQAMVPFFLAINLGNATNEEKLKAKAWQAYYREVSLIDITLDSLEWPITPPA